MRHRDSHVHPHRNNLKTQNGSHNVHKDMKAKK